MSRMQVLDLTAEKSTGRPDVMGGWQTLAAEEEADDARLAGPLVFGLLTLLIGFGGFFAWAILTPLAQASVAQGRIIVESKTKTVTHLEGGTLSVLHVREGDKVVEGQVLASLDVTRSRSTLTRTTGQLLAMQVRLARLMAERDGADAFRFEGAVADDVAPDLAAKAIANEANVFAERKQVLEDLMAMDRSQIAQLGSQRQALLARKQSLAQQVALVSRQYAVQAELVRKHLATNATAEDKKIFLVDLESRLDETISLLAENAQRAEQLKLLLGNRQTERQRDVAEQLQETQSEINRLTQERIYADDIVSKAQIRAPIAGTVANVLIRTPGSAIIAGQPLMDIVPADQPLLVEGRARAADIDSMHIGEEAEIRLTAFGALGAAPILGEIIYIAPDSLVDERSGEATYAFKASIPESELKKQPDLFLYPGMSADVLILNGNRTALAYLLGPVRRSFAKAFREQ